MKYWENFEIIYFMEISPYFFFILLELVRDLLS